MSLGFTIDDNAVATYERYLWSEDGLIKTQKKYQSTTLDFSLVPWDEDFIRPTRGSYVRISTDRYDGGSNRNFFTGYITNEPEFKYLGWKKTGPSGAKRDYWGYKLTAVADECILGLQPLGIIPTFFNAYAGDIIKKLILTLQPTTYDMLGDPVNIFNTDNIDDGQRIAVYKVDPTKYFMDVVRELSKGLCYTFYSDDHNFYWKPQDDISLPPITLDGEDEHYTPSRLSIKASTAPIVNDAVVLGQVEPQAYCQEFFIGTGLDGSFDLAQATWGSEASVFLDEQFSGTGIDGGKWQGDGIEDWLVDSGYLNIFPGGFLKSIQAFPMESHLRLTHGEWDFIGGSGIVAGLVAGDADPTADGANTIYGLLYDGTNIQPVVNGEVDADQVFEIDTSKRYILRSILEFSRMHRLQQPTAYIDENGARNEMGSETMADTCTVSTIITEVDPETGLKTRQVTFVTRDMEFTAENAYACYFVAASDSLNATVSNITLSTPVAATLEIATINPFRNQGFTEWDNVNQPAGWDKFNNTIREDVWTDDGSGLGGPGIDAPYSVRLQTYNQKFIDGEAFDPINNDPNYAAQFAVGKILPSTKYFISVRVRATPEFDSGVFKAMLRWHDEAGDYQESGIELDCVDLSAENGYRTHSAILTEGLEEIPDDLEFFVALEEQGPQWQVVWVSDIQINTEFKAKLIGPNEIDALDGEAPIATIVTSNDGALTKSSLTGKGQYNAGQSRLVFFKDTVNQISNAPTSNQMLRVCYRGVGVAKGRVQRIDSITDEASKWGDNGIRSAVRTDLVPLPRTSAECELAAAAIVGQSSFQHYEGQYNQFDAYFDDMPMAGGIITFVNMDNLAATDLIAEQIDSVVSTIKFAKPSHDVIYHEVSFAPADMITDFLAKLGSKYEYQQDANNGRTDINPPAVEFVDVGTTFLEDITKPVLVGWSRFSFDMDAGQTITNAEVRMSDKSWGTGESKNFITYTDGPFNVPTNGKSRAVFVKQSDVI